MVNAVPLGLVNGDFEERGIPVQEETRSGWFSERILREERLDGSVMTSFFRGGMREPPEELLQVRGVGIVESGSHNGSAARVAEETTLGSPNVDSKDPSTVLSSLDGVCIDRQLAACIACAAALAF